MEAKKKKKYTGFILTNKAKKVYQICDIKFSDKAIILSTI